MIDLSCWYGSLRTVCDSFKMELPGSPPLEILRFYEEVVKGYYESYFQERAAYKQIGLNNLRKIAIPKRRGISSVSITDLIDYAVVASIRFFGDCEYLTLENEVLENHRQDLRDRNASELKQYQSYLNIHALIKGFQFDGDVKETPYDLFEKRYLKKICEARLGALSFALVDFAGQEAEKNLVDAKRLDQKNQWHGPRPTYYKFYNGNDDEIMEYAGHNLNQILYSLMTGNIGFNPAITPSFHYGDRPVEFVMMARIRTMGKILTEIDENTRRLHSLKERKEWLRDFDPQSIPSPKEINDLALMWTGIDDMGIEQKQDFLSDLKKFINSGCRVRVSEPLGISHVGDVDEITFQFMDMSYRITPLGQSVIKHMELLQRGERVDFSPRLSPMSINGWISFYENGPQYHIDLTY